MDDMIKEKLALKEQVDSHKKNLSKQIKEKESLLQTFTVFKNESKEMENKYMENEIDLEKKIKEFDNIIYKVGQSAQTKDQRIKPTLYDGIVISDKHVAMLVIDDEETLILEEESQSKMSKKEKDPEAIKQNISNKPTDYEKLNRLSKDFGKRFTPQQELSAEQAFWFHMSNPTIESSDKPPVKVEVPSELLKVSLVNESLKKLKFHLALFDSVVKKRTTPNARTEVDKQCLEIAKKELLLENDQLLQQIMSQDVLLTVMNSMSVNGESVNVETQRSESCDKCLNLDAEFSKSKQAYNDLLKNYSQLEKHCISLELTIQLNQEIFQKDKSCDNQNALEIPEYFEINDLKVQLQDKDTTICKLKEIIKSLRGNNKEEIVNYNRCELETINEELENSVAKLLLENERLCKEINHLHAYLQQHELHANEVHIMRECNHDPLAFVANHQMTPPHFNTYQSSYNNPQFQQQFPQPYPSKCSPSQSLNYGPIHPTQHYSSTYPSKPQFNHSYIPSSHLYQSHMNHQTSFVPQIAYQSPQVPIQPMTESPFVDSGLAIPVFSPGDDPIACLNKAMAFLTAVASSRFPSTNNQLRTSSNPRNQATIQDGRVTVQQVQRRQGQSYSGNGYKGNATSSGGTNASGQARVVKFYNCQGEGHMARQCTQPKRPRNDAWFKDKALLAEAQEAGQILDEEQLAFLADLGIPDGQAVQTIIPNNAAFQTEDLDTYDSDCDDISNAKAVLMANISNYGSDVISEVPHSETYLNDMENQSVHAMQDFEQTPVVDFTDNEIHSDSNIILYSQYLQETQQATVQDTNLQAQQDSMILSVIEQMSEQMINHVNN
ncbi:retrovirus-related pol polyprotein from transposon TNT 1-94 [Tanacetum coccineum]